MPRYANDAPTYDDDVYDLNMGRGPSYQSRQYAALLWVEKRMREERLAARKVREARAAQQTANGVDKASDYQI